MNQRSTVSFPVGSWALSHIHGESVRILDVETVWNHTVYQVWIPRLATVERVPAESLAPAQATEATGLDRITYAVSAARIVIAERTGGAAW
jgi:malate/lactate dehydrogenase